MELVNPTEISRRAKAAGVSIPTLCRSAGLHSSTVYDWLKGAHAPNTASLERIILALERAEAAMVPAPGEPAV